MERAGLDRGRGGDLLDLLPGEVDDLAVQCRQMLEQVAVLVKRQPVRCFLDGVPYRGPGRAPRGDYRVGRLRDVLVCKGERRECCVQVPGEVGGEQADQQVRLYPAVQVVPDRADIKVVDLDGLEVPLRI